MLCVVESKKNTRALQVGYLHHRSETIRINVLNSVIKHGSQITQKDLKGPQKTNKKKVTLKVSKNVLLVFYPDVVFPIPADATIF